MELSKERSTQLLQQASKQLHWIILAGSEMEGQELPVSVQLIDQFNKAVSLSKQAKHADALAAWDKLLSPAPANVKVVATSEFLATCYLRKAYVLMDMAEYEKAKNVFENETLRATLLSVPTNTLSTYYFAFGNTLKSLGRKQEGQEMLELSKKYSQQH